jgi:hypothetical protein
MRESESHLKGSYKAATMTCPLGRPARSSAMLHSDPDRRCIVDPGGTVTGLTFAVSNYQSRLCTARCPTWMLRKLPQ